MHDALRQRLEAALGADAIVASPGEDLPGTILTVYPPTETAIAEVIRLCRETRTPIVPTGGGTLMEVGRSRSPGALHVSLERMTRLIEHDDANLTVTTQAGMTVHSLQGILAARSQFAVLDTPKPHRATVGGVVAVNINGYRRIGYRSIRDLVIGMRLVTGKGEVVKAGGKVVKNVAGYDMCKLFVGSLGTLGIITEITARVEPLPEREVTLVLAGGDGRDVLAIGEAIAASNLLPAAVAVLNAEAAGLLGLAGDAALVRLEGFSVAVARQEQEVRNRASRGVHRLDGEAHTRLWESLTLLGWEGHSALIRLMVPRSRLEEAWVGLESTPGVGGIAADVPSGTIWVVLRGDGDLAAELSAATALAERYDGHFLIARVPQGVEFNDRWGPAPKTLPIMRALKQAFDPDTILNPGRFLVS